MRHIEIDERVHIPERKIEIATFMRPFVDLVVLHEKFHRAFDELLMFIMALPPGSLIYLVGPSGIGKTALIRMLMNRFHVTEGGASSAVDSECKQATTFSSSLYGMPPIYIEVASPQKPVYEWCDFNTRMLKQLREPGIWDKTDLDLELKKLQDDMTKPSYSRRLPPDLLLFKCLEEALKSWQPPFACIDEVHTLRKMAKTAASFEDQMDVLRSISNLSKVSFVLSGTYKTKDLIYEGDETTRRSRVVHFGRYSNNEKDMEDYQDLLAALSEHSPLQIDFDPMEHLQFFYVSSVGCGGILKDWFSAANIVAILHAQERVSIADFKATALDNKQLVNLIKEINYFEYYFSVCPESDIIDAFWGAGYDNQSEPNAGKASISRDLKSRGHKRLKPGAMNPTRFPLDEG